MSIVPNQIQEYQAKERPHETIPCIRAERWMRRIGTKLDAEGETDGER